MASVEDMPTEARKIPAGALGMMPVTAHLATVDALQSVSSMAIRAVQEQAAAARVEHEAALCALRADQERERQRQRHTREIRITNALAIAVIVAGNAVLVISGP